MDAAAVAKKYRKRILALGDSQRKGLTQAAQLIDKEQVANLSGTGGPGSYPVPVRKGILRGGHGWAIRNDNNAAVFNTTGYAVPIHTGNMTTKEGLRYAVRPRPFLDDAANSVNVSEIVIAEVRKGFAV